MRIIMAIIRRVVGLVVAVAITLGLFLVLPLMQSIAKPPDDLLSVREVNVPQLEAPPEIEEEEPPEEEPEQEEEPPEFNEEPQQLDLNQLDLALNPGLGSGILNPDTSLNLGNLIEGDGGLEDLADFGSFDEAPRPSFTVNPTYNDKMRRALRSGSVRVVVRAMVDERGKVIEAKIHSGPPEFERSVLDAVKQWRFEPAKSKGKPVVGRVSIPFDFPRSG